MAWNVLRKLGVAAVAVLALAAFRNPSAVLFLPSSERLGASCGARGSLSGPATVCVFPGEVGAAADDRVRRFDPNAPGVVGLSLVEQRFVPDASPACTARGAVPCDGPRGTFE